MLLYVSTPCDTTLTSCKMHEKKVHVAGTLGILHGKYSILHEDK